MGGTDPAAYDTAHDEAYLRYAVARLGAYRHVWWSMANEWDLVACKGKGLPPRDDWERTKFATASPVWDQLFATLASEDPYAHLSSIHNQYLNYDHSKPWVTHISAQGEVRYVLPPVNTNAHVGWYDVGHTKRHFPTRPIVWDEVMYEGDVPFWGGLTAAQMADRFWWGLAHGVYVGHGETLTAGGRCYDDDACVDDDDHAFWWSKGGTLRGESPSRIRWFRTLAARLFDDVSCTCSAWGGVGSAAVCDDGCVKHHAPGDGVAIATDDATFFVLHAAHPYAAPPHAPADSVLELPPGEWLLQPIDIMAMRVLPPARTLRGGGGVKVRGSDLSPAELTTAAMRVPCNKWSSSTCCAAAAAACTPYVFVLTREPLAWPPPAPPPGRSRRRRRRRARRSPRWSPRWPPSTPRARLWGLVVGLCWRSRCSACCCASRAATGGGRGGLSACARARTPACETAGAPRRSRAVRSARLMVTGAGAWKA